MLADILKKQKEQKMILEVAILDITPGRGKEFETAFGEAQKIISRKEKDHVFKIYYENSGEFFNSLFL